MNILDKLKQNLYQRYKEDEIKNHVLSYLFLEITQKCNLKCLHCGSDCKSNTNIPELDTDSWLKIINYIANNFSNKLAFIITGGEPLMHKGLLKIGHEIKKNNMRWGMVTNGMLINQNICNQLIHAGIYSITLSFDGLEKSHNKLRGVSSAYKKVLETIDIIFNSQIPFKDIVTCVYPSNLNELDSMAKILIEKGVKDWRLFRIFPSGRAYNNNELLLTFQQTQQMLNWIKNNKKKYKKDGLNINLSCEGWLPFNEDKKVRDAPFFCRSGINIASILCDGTLTGCSNNHESFYVGNILNDNFLQVWNTKFDIFRKRKWINETICADCEYKDICMGGSIHLWRLGDKKPAFCYVKDISKID